ncbi:MAG: amidohydrolase family protein [Chloroflexi bacterium]|nr:amidohydrolase family protein [Chloroflexota bacterium]
MHALVGGKVMVKPGDTIDPATIVIRNGLIQSVGKDLDPPPDARVWDMKGLTIYPGLIDPFLSLKSARPSVPADDAEPALTSGRITFYGVPGQERDQGNPGPGYELTPVTPERRVASTYAPDAKSLEALREIGFTAGNVVPEKGILRGTSAFVILADAGPNEVVLKPDVFQHIAFDTSSAREGAYPRSLMGVIAATRQTFFDAQHYRQDQANYRQHPEKRKHPPFNPALEALQPVLDKKQPVVFEPSSALMVDRSARIAREFSLNFLVRASGQEWRRPLLAQSAAVPFIVPLNFPEIPKLPEEDDWSAVSLDQLRVWDWAPENPALLRRQGLEIALTTYGLSEKKNFRKNLRAALDRGLAETDALAALTMIPARLCGVEKSVGTIEAGKIANLTVVEGGTYFDPEAKVREVWIDGRLYPVKPPDSKPAKGAAESQSGGESAANQAEKAKETPPEDKTKAQQASRQSAWRDLRAHRSARTPAEGRGALAEPPAVLITGATVWTCGPAGRLEKADLLVISNKIQAVGPKLMPPPTLGGKAPLIIDARGQHLTPGLIDAHSHSMILGGGNEGAIPSSAMVRIGDVVNSETDNIYEQLAGGLTVANLLHGSANPIGGQNCIIKLKDGAAPEELKFTDAPPGIKFALGENVKQSSRSESQATRFPQSRMGVRTFIANRFMAAQQYLKEWEACQKSTPEAGATATVPKDSPTAVATSATPAVPPRRDLELEALAEVLQGKRWIHCHSYRQDEILMFLRLMEGFGVKIGTLQHVLEGYKVADEIARHGAGASCFSDWWAYKFEVYDAIPYAGSLMRERGALVSFNSDSSDHARRLYLEAAKAVKYGGTPEVEALKFVTSNPAKQLRIDHRVGSLEPGKDADFVLWSKSPLDSATVCLQTWIEGKKYFDRSLAAERAAALQKERSTLLDKARKMLANSDTAGTRPSAEQTAFFHQALEHLHDSSERHCDDE